MAPSLVYLPNGQTVTVNTVFGGLSFKANDLNTHHSVFPPGWTIIINSEDGEGGQEPKWWGSRPNSTASILEQEPDSQKEPVAKKHHTHRFTTPTLRGDSLYISSISNPSSTDFKPASSPTRQIGMMLWTTLYWYFHQPEPPPYLKTPASAKTAPSGQPKGDWRISIKREGIFKGRNLLQKLERMGLIASEDSAVGEDADDRSGDGWREMFISRRSFWQLDARIYLFTLSPNVHSPYPASSPYPSRPGSPNRDLVDGTASPRPQNQAEVNAIATSQGLWAPSSPGPFTSASHLPTYFPPPPLQFSISGSGIRHPIRPKPPRQGETFYTRYVPSHSQYLSFRVVSLSTKPPAHTGPVSNGTHLPPHVHGANTSDNPVPNIASLTITNFAHAPNDVEFLHKWMNIPRVAHFWGETGPQSHQEAFLRANLMNKHSFPVIGCWDGKPFGYFEIYWVREDPLGRHIEDGGGLWDRGVHALIGEEDYRGPARVRSWLSALVHYCFVADQRTESVYLEPRIDNLK